MSTGKPGNSKKAFTGHELEGYDLDFSGCNTRYLTHGIHPYPARMPPQIPKVIFNHYLRTGDIQPGGTVWDPFGGSGTTGLEAQLVGLNAVLTDLNPLACLISRTKTTPISGDSIYTAWNYLSSSRLAEHESALNVELRNISEAYDRGDEIEISRPDVSKRYEWFPKPQLYHLATIRQRIDAVEARYGRDVARVFRVALAWVCRRTSYQRNGEYKRYRIPEADRENFNPDVLTLYTERLSYIVNCVQKYTEALVSASTVDVHLSDSRLAEPLSNDSADIVVTSPPYGDHKTTVAYGQFSLDPAVISMKTNRDRMKQVDKEGLGGKNQLEADGLDELRLRSQTLDTVIRELESKEGRSEDALSFFNDYFEVLSQIGRVLKAGQPAIVVVANRLMSGIRIPTHAITMELFNELGFEKEAVLPRSLPYKTLPYENSPTNVVGQTEELMSDEYLVIARNSENGTI